LYTFGCTRRLEVAMGRSRRGWLYVQLLQPREMVSSASAIQIRDVHPHRCHPTQLRRVPSVDTEASRLVSSSVPSPQWWTRLTNVLGVSCAAGPALLRQSGAAVAANDVRGAEWRTATAVTRSRWRQGRQLGCRAEAGPHQLHTKVRPRPNCAARNWQKPR
jgi:hypothetical protein